MRPLHQRPTIFTLTFIPDGLLCSSEGGAACPHGPLPEVQVHSGGIRFNRAADELEQRIRVRNTSPAALAGRLVLVLDQLPSEVMVANADAALTRSLPASFGGHAAALGTSVRAIAAGDFVEFTLRFRNPSRQPIRYRPRVMLDAL